MLFRSSGEGTSYVDGDHYGLEWVLSDQIVKEGTGATNNTDGYLHYNGTNFSWDTPSGSTAYNAGNGINISSNTISQKTNVVSDHPFSDEQSLYISYSNGVYTIRNDEENQDSLDLNPYSFIDLSELESCTYTFQSIGFIEPLYILISIKTIGDINYATGSWVINRPNDPEIASGGTYLVTLQLKTIKFEKVETITDAT